MPERGRAIKHGNSDPQIKAPSTEQQAELRRLEEQLTLARDRLNALQPQLSSAQQAWEATSGTSETSNGFLDHNLVSHLPFDGNVTDLREPKRESKVSGEKLIFSTSPLAQAAEFSGTQAVEIGDVANFGFFDRFTISAWIRPQKLSGTLVGRMEEAADAKGYNLQLADGKLQLNLVVRWLDDALRVETTDALEAGRLQHIAVTYDGTRIASGIKMYLDGRSMKLRVILDELNQTFAAGQPLLAGAGGPAPRYAGSLDELRIYNRAISAQDVEILATTSPIATIVGLSPSERTEAQRRKLAAYFLDQRAPAPIAAAWTEVNKLEQQKFAFEESLPTTMVMEEMSEPRATYVLSRGEYDKPTERVGPAVPASLSGPDQPAIKNRLDFSRWLVSPNNPLTARVIVNRIWQMHFGQGLVKTVDDFGSQSEPPSHPQLLDYLATEFVASGWNLKALHKSIVMSATYRQSSQASPQLFERDLDNRLLARGPRLRLSAEMVRDQALFVSGLLVEKLGGPSVLPYQPVGLWKELGDVDFTQDHGESLYRRSMYTFWKRTVPPPMMVTFDAASREACWVRQMRTNTPLQALVLMNEITFVEAARVFAQRILREAGTSSDERLTWAFRTLLSRKPNLSELQILRAGLARHLDHYRQHPAEAEKLLAVGESLRDEKLDTAELSAYTAIANLLLNLDEAVTNN